MAVFGGAKVVLVRKYTPKQGMLPSSLSLLMRLLLHPLRERASVRAGNSEVCVIEAGKPLH